MLRHLEAFPDEFWHVQEWPFTWSGGHPTSVQQALLEMDSAEWYRIVDILFEEYTAGEITISDVMSLVRETNTCDGPDSDLNVWIDEDGDFKIKVYHAG